MISEAALRQTMRKLARLAQMLHGRIFVPVATLEMGLYQTGDALSQPPDSALFADAGAVWGFESAYGWFYGRLVVTEALAGQALFLVPKTGFYEATMWVNGAMSANFANKEVIGSHGNHYAKRITAGAALGEEIGIHLECYAYHRMPGTQPFSYEAQTDFSYPVAPAEVCVQDGLMLDAWADLSTLLALVEALPETSFRRADVAYALHELHGALLLDPDHDGFRQRLAEALPAMKAQLLKRNSQTTPYVGLIGHSHMDTAWLWPVRETVKKCARTYANQLSLMEQYPEYTFVQSSALHTEMIRRSDPALFGRIKEAIKAGRYEPNGGVWVECDCNLTGGEAMVRQFVWGQRYTMKHFDYLADAFWLPDTFGYSAAIPQIMKGCGIDYFLTTKMAWNDTNTFPYTSFLWQGLDGTRVLTHLNRTHLGPDPHMLNDLTMDGHITHDPIREKTSSSMRLFSYGKGDGGGGPEFEMIEMARRLNDLEGVARSGHTTVSAFMHALESSSRELSVYAGELYLELHRGTLTNQHQIKRNNRLAEIALHNLELATVLRGVKNNTPIDGERINPITEAILLNQFHDILPGTCIHDVHQQSLAETSAAIAQADEMTAALLEGEGADLALLNPLSFARTDTLRIAVPKAMRAAGGHRQQRYTDLDGNEMLAVAGISLPGLGYAKLRFEPGEVHGASPFRWDGKALHTPFAVMELDESGGICSYVDRQSGRQLAEGLGFNRLLLAEDVPASWDNWDIDADIMGKFAPTAQLISREVVSDGSVELRIRSEYRLTARSSLRQDMIVSADTALIEFDTRIDWGDGHMFLKAGFDTALHADGARHEIQFGHIRRPNHRSTDAEKARFEVCNHKYTDLSEGRFGVAILNDCKYGISCDGGSMWLSLHKGGMLPDEAGDMGVHTCRYALLPHAGGFSAETVIRPAYEFNYPALTAAGGPEMAPLASIDAPNVIIETVKPSEDGGRAYILRLYEAEGSYANAQIRFGHPVAGVARTNMLEVPTAQLGAAPQVTLALKPFEIVTLRVAY